MTDYQLPVLKQEPKSAEAELPGKSREPLRNHLGSTAHALNNVLSGILGYAELAMLSVSSESEAMNCLDEIVRAVHRAKGIVQQLGAFSRNSDPEA